jgi:hypothetical protein
LSCGAGEGEDNLEPPRGVSVVDPPVFLLDCDDELRTASLLYSFVLESKFRTLSRGGKMSVVVEIVRGEICGRVFASAFSCGALDAGTTELRCFGTLESTNDDDDP